MAKARYVADYRPGVLAQAAELAVARHSGMVDDSHVICEIGEVFAGRVRGREDDRQITIYKSLGHVAQDLAADRLSASASEWRSIVADNRFRESQRRPLPH